ncbi:MAG: UDP-N-acetylglucosamine 4,6-dehydratase (inverting) [Bacteroidetes bacterium GWE2_29_8]|nr:MAG: UDP-N-acetylglucosamine 4,6-dehydratase (inverting) [Bacteroidetes bacterium GWE2_29_8]OFY20036.1 MAG: UDP-N-acetylglucosamine 4,6-dehydratase (inverting) [Bacteroidetes bacterium GWF2_29_10]
MLDLNLDGKTILITGGTGSFGKRFVERILNDYPNIKKLIVFSRDELKQFEMAQVFSPEKYSAMRYFLGDIRDYPRFKRACQGVDIIVHAAALKQVPAAEYNPMEFIKTNINGAQNIIDASLGSEVKIVVALSTDKAAAPVNLYGATKLCSDKLFITSNNLRGSRDIKFSVVRYGNVMGSRGSVIPFFLKKRNEGVLPITNIEMTRFNILLDEGVDMVLYAIKNALGGEIFVPKIPSYKITDIAEAIAPSCKIKEIGIRPGEKLHEEMITETDSYFTIDIGKQYVILPNDSFSQKTKYLDHYNGKPVDLGFRYTSDKNEEWLNVEQLRELIKKHLDENFLPL